MPLPSFVVEGNLFDLLGNVTGSELAENYFGAGEISPAKVTFTSNANNKFVVWSGGLYRVKSFVAEVATDGTIKRTGEPVRLLANDAGLSLEDIQWSVLIPGQSAIWFNAPADGVTLDLATIVPVVELPVTQNVATLIQDAVTAATEGLVDDLIDGAPGALDTLNELAAALGDDANFATTVTNAIAAKYTLPGTGIPSTDFAAAVIASLGLADTSLQPNDPLADLDTAVTGAQLDALKTKVDGVASGATANSSDATLLARGNHTGTQSADTVVDGSTNHVFTAADDTKLAGIEALADVTDSANVAAAGAVMEGELALSAKYYGAIGDDSTHAVSTLIGGGGYASLALLREAFWTGCRFADDDNVVVIDPLAGSSTLYLAVGSTWAHITYNTSTGAITLNSTSGGITVSSGVLTGTSGADGDVTISATTSVLYIENRTGAQVAVKWSEAETTDQVDWLSLQHTLAETSRIATVYGGIANVIIPPGEYLSNRPLFVYSNTKVTNLGRLKFTGGDDIGGFIWIQSAENVELTGGIWDSNEQGNDNTIGVTHVAANQTVVGAASRNIKLHDMLIRGARHGGGHLSSATDPAEVGRGGGKGFTAQFGARDVTVSNVTIDDCDIGFSAEGKEDDSTWGRGGTSGITFSDVTVRGARYMGAMLAGRYNTSALYGQTLGIHLDNVRFEDCASGEDAEAGDVADNFGVVTLDAATHVTGNFSIRNTTGIVTAVRGSMRYCQLTFDIDAPSIKDVINGRAYGGYNGTTSPSRYNRLDARVLLNGAQAAGTGWLCTHDASNKLETSNVRLAHQYRDGATVGAWSGSQIIENQATTTAFTLVNLNDGSTIVATGGYVPVGATGSDYVVNGAGFDDDPGNSQVRIIPRASRDLAMAHSDGTAAIKSTTAAPTVDDTTAMLVRVKKGGAVTLDPVLLGPAGSGGSQRRTLQVASAGDDPGDLWELRDHHRLASGDEAMPRELGFSNVTMTSQILRLSFFTARSSYTATQLRLLSGGTAAGATPTLVRAGIYSVAGNGDIALLAAIASDTAIFAGTSTAYTRSLTASQAIVKGVRYALGILVDTGATAPTVPGSSLALAGSELGVAPRLSAQVSGQTDLPSSVVNGSLVNSGSRIYGVVLP